MKLVFFPVFETAGDLADYVYRAAWYLYPLADKISGVDFFIKGGAKLEELPKPGPEMADDLPEIAHKFRALTIKDAASADIFAEAAKADFVFVHKEETRNGLIKRLPNSKQPKILRVDKVGSQYADSFFLRFFENFPEARKQYTAMAADRCAKLLAPLRREKSYIFGTGPNFSFVEGFDFSDGLVIACNSIAVNAEILDALNPNLFVIADPIFHAGPSSYAYTFRKALAAQMASRTCPLVVPLRDYHLYRTYLPESLQPRIIPVDFMAGDTPRLDLLQAPAVTTTSNILTLFQIPLAATLSKQINISGCDGRPLTDNGYFWSHNAKVQINDKMDDIKRAHPAFFNISYDDYYTKHISVLESWAAACEANGIKVANLTPSYIPALQSRQSSMLLPHVRKMAMSAPAPRVSIIIPLYNCAKYLEEAVASLLDEGRDDLEIIVVDDFSDDGSLAVARTLAEKHPQIRVVQNFRSKGVSGARNTGIDLALGEFIGFLDADDIVPRGSLNARVECLIKNPATHVVHGHCRMINDTGEDLGVEIYEHRDISFAQMSGSGSHFNTIVIRASELREKLRFQEGLSNGEDWLALAQVLRLGYVSKYVAAGWANYRVHPQSAVMKDFSGHERKLLGVIDWICGPVADAQSSEKFRSGLSSPPKAQIITNRLISQVVFNALVGDVARLDELLADSGLRSQIASAKGEWGDRIKVPAVRVTACHFERLFSVPTEIKSRVQEGLASLKRWPETQKLVTAIEGLFKLDAVLPMVAAAGPDRRSVSTPAARGPDEELVERLLRMSARILLDPGSASTIISREAEDRDGAERLLKAGDKTAAHFIKVCEWAKRPR